MTFAEEMVEKYQQLLRDSAGLKRVMVDGQDIWYAELEERYAYWKRIYDQEQGTKGRTFQIDLSGF